MALDQGFTYNSYVDAINDRDQMVGIVGEGVIWQNGKMQKLRNLIAIDTFVQSVAGINKYGMIAANAASAPDYNLGPALLVPLDFRARDGRINYGFDPPLKGDLFADPPVPDDPTSEPPWASAVCGTTSDNVKLVLPGLFAPKLKLTVVDGAEFVDLSPSDTPLSNGETTLVLSGSSAVFATPETAEVEAQLVSNSDKASSLKVLVLPERTVSVGIYRVADPDSPATSPVEGPTNSEIIAALDDIYKQTGVKFNVQGSGSPPAAYDANRDGRVQISELQTILNTVATEPGAIKVILVRESAIPYEDDPSRNVRATTVDQSSVLFCQTISENGGDIAFVEAHEMGHALALPVNNVDRSGHDVGPPPLGTGRLMGSGAPVSGVLPPNPAGRWLAHEDWQRANVEANFYQ